MTTENFLLVSGGDVGERERIAEHLASTGMQIVDIDSLVGSEQDRTIAAPFNFADFGHRLGGLTQGEKVVLQLILEGKTNKAVSSLLQLTERAVELRKASLMRKLRVRTHTALVREITRFETWISCLVRGDAPHRSTPAPSRMFIGSLNMES